MKKLFFASLWVLACLTAACSDEKDEPNGESDRSSENGCFRRTSIIGMEK